MWNPEMLDALMKSAVKNIREGKRKATGLPRETWADIARDVAYASPGPKGQHITWEKCQTKMESLRKKWKLHCRLMKTPGFSKCPITGAVVGPEHLWLEEQKVITLIPCFVAVSYSNTNYNLNTEGPKS
jgi:hypothetical protein